MNHFSDFTDWLNNHVGGNGPLPNLLHGDYGAAMGQSLERHFVEDRQRGGVRMSNIGKPATLLALAKLGYTEPEPRGRSRLIFHMGDMYENFLEVMLQSYGIEILESQGKVEWTSNSGISVDGHFDYLVKSPVTGEPVVVEAKTMSQNYSRMFRNKPDDDRGYVTQLSLYATCKGYDGAWLCLDKGNAETFEIPLEKGLVIPSLERAEKVLDRVAKVNKIEDVLKVFRAPPLRAEVYQKQQTGRYLIPTMLKMSPFRHVIYKTFVDKNNRGKETEYAAEFADVTHMKEVLEKLVDSKEIVYNGS